MARKKVNKISGMAHTTTCIALAGVPLVKLELNGGGIWLVNTTFDQRCWIVGKGSREFAAKMLNWLLKGE